MEEIYTLIKRAQKNDSEAKEKVIQMNNGLIWSIVKKFHGRGDPDDLYQLGTIGLLKAIERFDFTYDVKFSTYAVPLIMGEIKCFLRDDGKIKVSRRLKELAFQAKSIQEQIIKEKNRELSVYELSELLNVSKEDMLLALEATKEVESIYAVQNNIDGKLKLMEQLNGNDEFVKTIDKITLAEALSKLNSKERKIIYMRYFQDRTQMDIATQIGISQVQISRIEKRVLQQLKISMQ